jgi:flagellar hook-associated protein 3 FlgL
MDDLQYCYQELKAIETAKSDLEAKMEKEGEGSANYADYQKQMEAVEKAESYIRESIHTKFENQITKYQNYIDDTNVAITENATRGSRLELITTRLMNQKTTFKELQTNNEDIDVSEVAVELSSSQLTYQAALMATSKIMQTNLMNYI